MTGPLNQEVTALATEIPKHLTMKGWTTTPHEDLYRPHVTLEGPDGASVSLVLLEGKDKSDIRILTSGTYPRNFHRSEPHSITIAFSRGFAAIARDLERRFLVPYLDAYMGARAAEQRYKTAEEERSTAERQIAGILGSAKQPNRSFEWKDPTISAWDHYGSVKAAMVSARYGMFEAHAPYALVERLARVAAEWLTEQGYTPKEDK